MSVEEVIETLKERVDDELSESYNAALYFALDLLEQVEESPGFEDY